MSKVDAQQNYLVIKVIKEPLADTVNDRKLGRFFVNIWHYQIYYKLFSV